VVISAPFLVCLQVGFIVSRSGLAFVKECRKIGSDWDEGSLFLLLKKCSCELLLHRVYLDIFDQFLDFYQIIIKNED
jgi:hypothetical protein